MSKRHREKSPTSEGTLIQNIITSGVTFIDDGDLCPTVENELRENDSGEEDSDFDLADDTDEDPDFNPEDHEVEEEEDEDIDDPGPSTSSGRPRPRGRPRSSNLGNDQNSGGGSFETRPRGRQRRVVNDEKDVYNVQWPIFESDANAGWKIVSEENDLGNVTEHGFYEQPGPRHCLANNARPIDYFYLFFTETLLTTFVTMTNLYATRYLEKFPNSSIKWSPVTLAEIKAFIAVILNMGLNKRPTIDSYWRTKSKSQSLPWFREMFSRNRFEIILRFFHITDSSVLPKPGEPNYDPCSRFSLLVEHANRVFRRYYVPHRELSIDESLIGTKSHTMMTQYLPNKHHHRWGIKLWMMCDSVSNYCLGFFCYKGKKENELNENKQEGLAHKVVVKLLEMGNYLNKGYHIFVDNFFLSIPLARFLFSKETYITGTIRRNRQEIPYIIKEKLKVGQQCYVRNENENILMLSYREKKTQKNPVLLLSTKFKAKTVEKTKKRQNDFITNKKPEVIDKYNMYMGGIDTSDQMVYCYLDERRTLKYWRKVTFNIMARMVLNTYILYKENNAGKILNRYDYTADIIDQLAEEWFETRQVVAPVGGGGDGIDYGIDHLPGRLEKNCSVCSPISTANGGPRKRSRYCCKRCKRGIHPLCFGQHRCK